MFLFPAQTVTLYCLPPIGPGDALEIASAMPQGGAVFSDGVEQDFLPFDSGAAVTERRVHLVAV